MPEKKKEAPPPATAAGLLRFFEDESSGIQIDPMYIIVGTIIFIVISFILRLIL